MIKYCTHHRGYFTLLYFSMTDLCVCTCVTVSQALKENSYPFLALIVLRDNRMTVVSRIEGPIGQLLFSSM